MRGAKAQRIADSQRIGVELRLVIRVALHATVGAKPLAAAKLEQPVIPLRLEAALFKQHTDVRHLFGPKPEARRDLGIGKAGACALALDPLEIEKPHRIAAAVLNVGAQVEDDRAERLDHLRTDAEPLTSRRRRHSVPFGPQPPGAPRRV